jgi:hypothetical protein
MTREHGREILGLVLVLIVNESALFILRTKSQQHREGHVVNGELVSLSGQSDCVFMSINEVGAVELRQNLLIPIVAKAHEIKESNFLALLNHLIEHKIVELFIVPPISEPHLHNGDLLLVLHGRASNHCEIEVMIQIAPKP